MSGSVRSSEVNNNSSGRLSPLPTRQSVGSTATNSYQNSTINRNNSEQLLSTTTTTKSVVASSDSCSSMSSNKENNSNNNVGGSADSCSSISNSNKENSRTTFSLDKNEEFHFVKPPEVPVFKPNDEEFKNPLGYISKIRPVAEKFGIVKIKPPKSWTPPFAVDVDKLRFTPRVQRLNELEAKTRVKLNFLDQIAKFWELQGSSLKIPQVERKILDLYSLHRIVQEEGGMEQVTRERKWSKVSLRMGYPPGKNVGATLRCHYERILHPYNIFTAGKVVDLKLESDIDDKSYRPHRIISRQQITPPNEATARRSKRFANSTATCGLGLGNVIKDEPGDCDEKQLKEDRDSKAKELRRLQFYGAGPKMAGYTVRGKMAGGMNGKKKSKIVDPLAKYICYICSRGDAEESMLLCDGCDDSYHMFCLMPPLIEIPKGDWRCPKCIVEEVSKPQEAFGFEQASREYTLQQFGEMADQFKADYFNMAVHLVPTDLVEREFWRIVSSIDEDVTVEYGADLHTLDHGSGFPTKESINLLPGDKEYAESSWNLNNLPLLEESILGHINADISGMKVPWMYVGMCFATFCWHNEDHWSYSINYLHWGEPKTWYGVPGSSAEAFEETMKSAAPELFHSQPDLLHQLVTIMNPNILMKAGVPVYRTDQHAGEFVVTFPRAYHAGFNQGYNFAEAVNFAPADWLKMGRECINHYSMLRRFCVFSHDELVCKMALDPDKLNLGIATACYLDMTEMVESEKKLRKSLLEWGVTKAERQPFELIPDDERQCDSCKTTIFLSAVSCTCSKGIVCLRHYTELCDCLPENHTLKYRYTLDELPLMLKKLKVKAESFENWLSRIRNILDPNTATTITLEELQELAQEAEEKKFPNSVLLERLKSAVLEAEKCVIVIQQLDINKVRTRSRNSGESAKYKLSLEELELFVQEIDNLCCTIKEGQSVRELLTLGKEFVESAKVQLSKTINKADEKVIERLIDEGTSLCIELHEIKALKDRQRQVNWYNRVKQFRESREKKSINDIDAIIKEGLLITPDSVIEKQLVLLQDIISSIEDWELLAAKCLESGSQHDLSKMELLLERAEEIQGILPTQGILKDAIKKTKEWLLTVEILQANENYPYFHTLENVVSRGKNIPFQLEELRTMDEHLESARQWKERAAKKFLKKESTVQLIDVLSPRTDGLNPGSKAAAAAAKKRNLEDHFKEEMDISQIANFFKNAADKELEDMRELRKLNAAKSPEDDKFCICKRKVQGQMYQCQLCKDWFHKGCVSAPRNIVRPRTSNVSGATGGGGGGGGGSSSEHILQNSERDIKYLCDTCTRSRRPHLQTVLSLLVSLQRVPIRLPEGEALQHLTERAMQWQDRARQAIETEDVALALKTLSTISQKLTDTTSNNNNDNKKRYRKKSRTQMTTTTTATSTVVDGKNKLDGTMGDDDEFLTSSGDEELSADSSMEHTYSAAPMQQQQQNITTTTTTTLGINSNSENSNSNKIDAPLINLNKDTIENLEDLMMEGDLLEVSLDETSHIWRILSAARTLSSSSIVTHMCLTKKRKLDDSDSPSAVKRLAKMSSSTTKGKATTTTTVGGVNISGGGAGTGATAATAAGGANNVKRKRRGRKAQKEQQETMTSDEDDECSAAVCEKPTGREVDWIQCDGECNQWFHMFCVGLDKNQVKPEDDYICKRCKLASSSSIVPTSSTDVITTITAAEITTLSSSTGELATTTATTLPSPTTTTTIGEAVVVEESAASTTQQLTPTPSAVTT